ncbi:thiolase family protein [Anatilimnocola floriformis]|uniref:thiolase family protein n=1 Tax=Anatilimnocola floriformis TaxID=2948575 RepID=UPI0020C51898|nr:thiolase family protein [Anatilimnocola floriformis]
MLNGTRAAVIAAGARTPFARAHAEKGWLRNIRADELAAHCIRTLLTQQNLDPEIIDDVIVGCALQTGEMSLNAARQIALLAGLPVTCPAVTVNRLCGSSLQALHQAVHAIEAGHADVQLVVGVEKMTGQTPPPSDLLHPQLAQVTSPAAMSMGLTAEFLAQRYNISRADQDAFAARSHQLAAATNDPFVIPISGHNEHGERILIDRDQTVRADTNIAALSRLPAAFVKGGTVTAGNSSPRNDGAAALLVMSRETASELGLPELAIVRGTAVAGITPSEMGLGPVPAIKKLLQRAKLSLSNIDAIELNEAFAAQALACIRQAELDPEKVNRRGGAIAIGHPLGASGVRLILSLLQSLQTTDTTFGLAAMCIGMGQGIATLLERTE